MISKKLCLSKLRRKGESGSNVLVVANYNEEKIRLALARMIIIDELSFKFMERQGFSRIYGNS